jgi:hypothetical protein
MGRFRGTPPLSRIVRPFVFALLISITPPVFFTRLHSELRYRLAGLVLCIA